MCSDTGQKSAKQVKTAVFWEQNINITKLGKYFSLAHVTCLGLGPTYAVHLRPSHFGIGWQPEALSRSQASHMWGTWHASSIWVWGAVSIWSLAHWHPIPFRQGPGISSSFIWDLILAFQSYICHHLSSAPLSSKSEVPHAGSRDSSRLGLSTSTCRGGKSDDEDWPTGPRWPRHPLDDLHISTRWCNIIL
jgi:hypothetical protein